jgi:hypothetical protein
MFGFKNFTGRAFIGRIGNASFEFAVRVVEEVMFNVTPANPANALEILENFNLNLVSKDQIINSTSLVVTSKILQKTNVFGLIAGATSNLLR